MCCTPCVMALHSISYCYFAANCYSRHRNKVYTWKLNENSKFWGTRTILRAATYSLLRCIQVMLCWTLCPFSSVYLIQSLCYLKEGFTRTTQQLKTGTLQDIFIQSNLIYVSFHGILVADELICHNF